MPTFDVPDGRGTRLCYDDVGEGPPVLLLQGVGVARRAWAPQVDELSRRFRCVAVDHRGIGGSEGDLAGLSVDVMARDAIALVEALGLDGVHVVGHSLGGVVAQRFALEARARTRSLALLCTFAGGKDLARPTARLAWLGLRTRVGTARMRREAFARLVSPEARFDALGLDAVIAELESAFGRRLDAAPDIASAQLAALRAHDERSRLGELAGVPTLVASARHDPIATEVYGRALAAAIPGARFVEWEDASHAVTIQDAALVNAALETHFRSTRAA